jgi:hypothetical protein
VYGKVGKRVGSSDGKGVPLWAGAGSVDVGSVVSLRSSVGEDVAVVKGSWVAGATKGCGVERLAAVGARGIGEGMGVGGGARAKAVEGSTLRTGLTVSAHGAGVEGAVDGAGVDVGAGMGISVVEGVVVDVGAGISVGEGVGVDVGAGVGVSVVEGIVVDVGAGVGLDVGETRDDRSALGAADEGIGVGLRLGSALGCFVGAGGGYGNGFVWKVGALECCSKGHSVGVKPGTRDGADDSEVLYDGANVGKAGVFSATGIFVGANVRPSLSKVTEMLDGESLGDGSGLDGKLVGASDGLPVDGALVGK